MKKILFPILAVALALGASAKAPKDPVLMTVDGQPVTLSEFEYLYHKNADQQLEKESVDDYLKRFIDYKLKVAQARHERRDTTAQYQKEFKEYRLELALPFLRDTVMEQKILNDSYAHTLENVNVDHIMLPLDRRDLADSIRQVIVSGQADFLDMAAKHSVDPSLKDNGGKYGWISARVYPYAFEEGAYDTPVGEISPVIETPYGFHLLRVNGRRPDAGEVHAAHILVQTKAGDDAVAAKARIDSIYQVVLGGKPFDIVAMQSSDCPSKEKGGDLGWFGHGQMVPEFEEVAFGMKNGEISEPVKSRFGWHIINRIDARRPSKRDVMGELQGAIARDERSVRPRVAYATRLRKEYNTRINTPAYETLMASVNKLGYDSTRTLMLDSTEPLFFVADSAVTIGNFVQYKYRLNPRMPLDKQLDEKLDERMNSATLVYENHHLEEKYPEFRNVSREYAEGLLLFASMEDNVWNRPTTDPKGLEAYFEANRDKYAFESPRWKGYIIYATTDSLMNEVNTFLNQEQPSAASLGDELKARFPRNIRIERVVLPQGQNEIVDFVAFGAPEPKITGRWANYVTYLGHVIEGPEEAADVRAKVSGDWVAELEEQWIKDLRERYPVKVNKKVLKKVK